MSNRNVRNLLIMKHGKRCMLCGRQLENYECTLHHIKPISAGGETTEENGAVLCIPCHTVVHLFKYGDSAYTKLTRIILRNKFE